MRSDGLHKKLHLIGRAFILTGAYSQMSSSETESTASDMSDLSYEQ
jgi:hypothetical protein